MQDELFPTYEAVEGDVGGMGHLRVKYSLQLLQYPQLICHIRLFRCADVHDRDFSHNSARGVIQLQCKRDTTPVYFQFHFQKI